MKRPEPPALVEVNTRIFYPSRKLEVYQFSGDLHQMYKWQGVSLEWILYTDHTEVRWVARIADRAISCLSGHGLTPLTAFQVLQVNAKKRAEEFDSEVRDLLARQQKMHAAFHDVLEDA